VQGVVVLLQATSPLRRSADIRGAIDLFATGGYGLVMSVTEADRGVLKWGRLDGHRFVPLSAPEHCFANRQSLPPVVRPNGAVYVFDAARLIGTGSLAADTVGVVTMPPERSHDIDHLNDFEQAERLLATLPQELP
jgi:N-acylneuraminate cytidylyltransferase